MTAIIASQNGEEGGSLGTSHPIPTPSGVTVGNLLLAFCTLDAPGSNPITASAGWTEKWMLTGGSNVVRFAGFARIADGGADDNLELSGTTQDYCAEIIRIVDHSVFDVSTDLFVATDTTSVASDAEPPALDVGSTIDGLWITACGVDFNAAGITINTDPTDYTNVVNRKSSDSASSCGMRIAQRSISAQVQDPDVFDISTNRIWCTVTLAVTPSVTGASFTGSGAVIEQPDEIIGIGDTGSFATTIEVCTYGESGTTYGDGHYGVCGFEQRRSCAPPEQPLTAITPAECADLDDCA